MQTPIQNSPKVDPVRASRFATNQTPAPQNPSPEQKSPKKNLIFYLVCFVVVFFTLVLVRDKLLPPSPVLPGGAGSASAKFAGLKPFASVEEFKDYLQESQLTYSNSYYYGVGRGSSFTSMDVSTELTTGFAEKSAAPPSFVTSPPTSDTRVSETNVQVLGIDEPDIVKTDGTEIYYSREQFNYYWRESSLKSDIASVEELSAGVEIINALPPTGMSVISNIDKQGDLLLFKNNLVVFTYDVIYGYDVSDPKNPTKKWELKFENNNYLVTARAYKDKIYLVTQQNINDNSPCPIRPLSLGGKTMEIACADIYHPINAIPVQTAYTAVIIDPATGATEKSISFVGSTGGSVVYMSSQGLYITYSFYGDYTEYFYNFLTENTDLFPAAVTEKVKKLMSYDISQQSKLTELQVILENYQNGLSNDERLKLENELVNRMDDYSKVHRRDLQKTGIAKISLADFKVSATGEVPGTPLNQFSLDEYNEYLRVAVTIGQNSWMFGSSNGESANDVYVLDKDLKITGSVQDLGLTERIYSARFVEDRGYLVTFRQTDPFYVLDLSNPAKPELKGELKIPGYSSYLHPIAKDRILGFGKEGSQVKISLFNVADPANPTEADKYLLQESWSDVLNTHHAFLADSKHEIFFLPGSSGGYVFSYSGDKLALKKATSGVSARRALYINDYLYIIGDNKISVLDETAWEKAGELDI